MTVLWLLCMAVVPHYRPAYLAAVAERLVLAVAGAGVAGAGVAGAAVGGAVACLVVGGGVGDGVAAQTSQILTLSSSMTPFSSTQYLVGQPCAE